MVTALGSKEPIGLKISLASNLNPLAIRISFECRINMIDQLLVLLLGDRHRHRVRNVIGTNEPHMHAAF